MKTQIQLTLTFLLLVLIAGCGFTKSKQIAAKSVNTYHQQFNQGRFEAIYSSATAEFRSNTPESEFRKYFQAIRRKLGVFKSSTEAGWRMNQGTNGTIFVLTYNSQFEGGNAIETFAFAISGESAALASYNINCPTLVLDSPILVIHSPPTTPHPSAQFTSADSQREAIRRFPQLGVAGSPLNQDFVARYKRYQRERPEQLRDPSWPLRLAEESARAVKSQ